MNIIRIYNSMSKREGGGAKGGERKGRVEQGEREGQEGERGGGGQYLYLTILFYNLSENFRITFKLFFKNVSTSY